jgi:hypothetical protein
MFCSGKVYYDLAQQRETLGYNNTAIVRIEELAPFPLEGVVKTLEKYRNAKEYFWVQDEIQNGGAWFYMQPRLNTLIGVTCLLISDILFFLESCQVHWTTTLCCFCDWNWSDVQERTRTTHQCSIPQKIRDEIYVHGQSIFRIKFL